MSRDRSPSSGSSSSRRRRDSPDYTTGSNTRSRESRSPSPIRDSHNRHHREYHDRDTAPPRAFGGENNNRSNHHWRKNHENDTMDVEPQLEIILQGLPLDCLEDDIRRTIADYDVGVETVRIARDRRTGEPRGFGFLRFSSLQHSQDFMKEWGPSIRFGQSRARIAYSNNPGNLRETHHPRCFECGMTGDNHHKSCPRSSPSKQGGHHDTGYRMTQHSPNNIRQQGRAPSQQQQGGFSYKQTPSHNVGMQDIGQVPNAILIATDLPIMVNEMGLWDAFKTLGPLRRIMMAKDRLSRIAWGFCFAEYENPESATAALKKAHETEFAIQTQPIDVHFAHLGSFIPAYAPTKWTIDFANESQLAIYWDEQAFLSVYVDPSAKQLAPAVKMAPKAPVDELDAFYAALGDVSKAGPAQGDRASIFSIPNSSEPTTAPVVIQELPSLPTAPKLDDVQLAGIAAARAAEQLAKSEDRKRKAAPPSIGIGGGGKKVSNNLQKWSTKQVELHSDGTGVAAASVSATATVTPGTAGFTGFVPSSTRKLEQPTGFVPVSAPNEQETVQESNDSTYDPDELLDLKLLACLLCKRKFNSVAELRKHQSLSDLHKKNLLDTQAIQTALKKSRGTKEGHTSAGSPSKAAATAVPVTAAAVEEEPKYRDRAAERRQIFGQPDYPLPPTPGTMGHHNNNHGRGRGSGVNFEDVAVPEQPTKDGIKEDNIGNRLLKSMGWKEGQGLGKDGEGIKDPIQASGYSRGVGIGAGVVGPNPGGASNNAGGGRKGGGGYQALSAKEVARRRYEQSGQQ
ncbi:RNA-binding protein 5/10 [Entomortierella parvispora]|uniref:RNA-binding protein 5/10 n=1 Tax=Entomortierella parvispora TaxID=205924 RepID=A0A9P3M1W9_9FUNG|nr:RNA-binding protein 5/10 [Entomortierella parvispora]